MTGSAMRILRDSLIHGRVIWTNGDRELCHQSSPFQRWIWQDAKDQLYLAGFASEQNAMHYGRLMGWVK